MPLSDDSAEQAVSLDFDNLVGTYYRPLYQFAFSLTRKEAEARDLTQQTFYIWAIKGHQLRDATKVKTWLFSTLHREFLKTKRRQKRFPHVDVEKAGEDMPAVSPAVISQLDGAAVMQALSRVEEIYQAPLALFYLEDYSYKEIAEILEVPLGTVQSRIARGRVELRKVLIDFGSDGQNPTRKTRHG